MTGREVTPRWKKTPAPPKQRGYGSTLPRATKRINHTSKQTAAKLEGYDDLKKALRERSGGRCEMGDYGLHADGCNGWGQDPHHILPRSLGGQHELDNLAWLSRACHDHCELDPIGSKQTGVSKGRYQ